MAAGVDVVVAAALQPRVAGWVSADHRWAVGVLMLVMMGQAGVADCVGVRGV